MAEAQARNVKGIGWIPSLDDEQEPAVTPVEQRCLSALAAEGQKTVTATDRYFAYTVCGAVLLYEEVLRRASGSSDATSIAREIASLGASFRGPGVVGGATRYGADRPFGPASARPFAWTADCRCFRYSGPAVSIP